MCRSVELDYVDRGEGVCYRLLRSVSCLQQLHHDNILPLQVVNLDATANRLTLFYADAGVPLETILQTRQLPIYQAWGCEDVGVFIDWCSVYEAAAVEPDEP